MIPVDHGALRYYRFASFGPTVAHGALTRRGGHSTPPWDGLNVGGTVGDDPAHVAANLAEIYVAFGLSAGEVTSARQVHGARVAVAGAAEQGQVLADTDALITATPGQGLLLRLADCMPVFFYAPRQSAVGLAHAGWRGTVAGIAARTAQAMVAAFGCRPEEILAGLGPAIGPCCFEVGPEVVAEFEAVFGGPLAAALPAIIARRDSRGHAYVDLAAANAAQLRAIGVTQIEAAGLCTACHRDEFFSHRAEHGRTGRAAAVIVAPVPEASSGEEHP